jgi:hypothetical protein
MRRDSERRPKEGSSQAALRTHANDGGRFEFRIDKYDKMRMFDGMTKKIVNAQLGVILILVAIYFLQVATPLRLHPDTVVLLSIAETAERGGGYLYHGQRTVFPPGYPMLLAFLIRVDLAHVWVIVGINVVFVAIGLLAVYYIFRSEQFSKSFVLGVCLLSLLSFVFIKYSAIPLTDALFFGVSMCCLALMKRLASEFSWRGLIGALVLAIASVCIRRVGVALIPALLYTAIFQSSVRHYIVRLSFRMKAAIVLVAAFAGGAMVWVVSTTSTLLDFSAVLTNRSLIDSVRGILAFRLKELGEIAVNLPFPTIAPIIQGVLPIVGTLAFVSIVAGVGWRKQFGVVEIYFMSYVAIILVWPFYDPRFWLPVIPFLIAYSGLTLRRLMQRKIVMYLVEGYVLIFVLMGILTLASNTRLSFSGSRFGDSYTDRRYHSTYCAVWHCKDLDSATVDLDGLHLLRYYRH